MRATIIYKITNLLTGQAYIGATMEIKRRLRQHRRENPHFFAGGAKIEELACCKRRNDGGIVEAAMIVQHQTLEPVGYNRGIGNFKGYVHTQQTRQRMAKPRNADRKEHKKLSAEQLAQKRDRLREYYKTHPGSRKGQKITEETRQKMRDAAKRRCKKPYYGRVVSEEQKEKARATRVRNKAAGVKATRKPMAETTKQKISARHKARFASQQPVVTSAATKEKISQALKAYHARKRLLTTS